MLMKYSSDNIWNRTRDLPDCNAVSQLANEAASLKIIPDNTYYNNIPKDHLYNSISVELH